MFQSLWSEDNEVFLPPATTSGGGGLSTGQRLRQQHQAQERARRRRLVADHYARAIDVFRREALPNELMTWQDIQYWRMYHLNKNIDSLKVL